MDVSQSDTILDQWYAMMQSSIQSNVIQCNWIHQYDEQHHHEQAVLMRANTNDDTQHDEENYEEHQRDPRRMYMYMTGRGKGKGGFMLPSHTISFHSISFTPHM